MKEAQSLADTGHEVVLLYCYVSDWAQSEDVSLLSNVAFNHCQIGGSRKQSFSYQWSRFKFAIYKKLNDFFGVSVFSEQAHARCYSELRKRGIAENADWYIGHNPGAMSIVASICKKVGAKAGFDFEDYHRGEYTNIDLQAYRRQVYLEDKYIHTFSYLTAASDLINNAIQTDFPNVELTTIMNVFEPVKLMLANSPDKIHPLRLFWFSQHLGNNRGLNFLIETLARSNPLNVSLTLAGNYTEKIKNEFITLAGPFAVSIVFVGVIPPNELPLFTSKFDVGLALEPGFSSNNKIALSNKIFTYISAGLAIIFSETPMQYSFCKKYKAGKSFPIDNEPALVECLSYFQIIDNLNSQKSHNYNLANTTLNWKHESEIFLKLFHR